MKTKTWIFVLLGGLLIWTGILFGWVFLLDDNEDIKSTNDISTIEFVETQDRNELQQLMYEMENRRLSAANMAQAARELGYPEDHEIIVLAKANWEEANNLFKQYEEIYKSLGPDYSAKAAEYPAATEIWVFLKEECGYSDYVCAGILGNLMAEVGGHTLDIRYWLTSSSGYYGMCQWSKGYAEVQGVDLRGQCEFLQKTIQYEFDTYGNKYQPGFNYEAFLNLTDERECALAFAKCYERCNSAYYNVRQDNAEKAYNYFTN